MRRDKYAANPEKYREQKRIAYARRMAASGKIVWPKSGIELSTEDFKEIRDYYGAKGIQVAGLKNSMVDKDLAKEVADKVSEIDIKYGIGERLTESLTVYFDGTMDADDFAETPLGISHIIKFNKNAYRNKESLKREYNKLADSGYFVKGTTYKCIPYHEAGHIVSDIYELDGLEIAKGILGIENDADVLEKIESILSKYAASKADGSEIISECFAAVYDNVDNDFALKVIEECDKIIANKR